MVSYVLSLNQDTEKSAPPPPVPVPPLAATPPPPPPPLTETVTVQPPAGAFQSAKGLLPPLVCSATLSPVPTGRTATVGIGATDEVALRELTCVPDSEGIFDGDTDAEAREGDGKRVIVADADEETAAPVWAMQIGVPTSGPKIW